MGTINHNAVLATTWDAKRVDAIKAWIDTLPGHQRRQFVHHDHKLNAYQTIALLPDASKEGWSESDEGDALRMEFIKRLDTYWDWIEVGYGEFGASIESTNCEDVVGGEYDPPALARVSHDRPEE